MSIPEDDDGADSRREGGGELAAAAADEKSALLVAPCSDLELQETTDKRRQQQQQQRHLRGEYYDAIATAATTGSVVAVEPSPFSSETSALQGSSSNCDSLWRKYNSLLDRHPLPVKSVTAFFILGGGDLAGQFVEHVQGTAPVAAVDWIRTARFAAFGLCGAPWAHYYYHYLDSFLPPTPRPLTATTFLKVFIDQFVQAPLLLALMISLLSLLKGEGIAGVRTDMSSNYLDSLIANWKLWLPASFFNLAFVKPTHRVLFVNVVFFVWMIILSIMLNRTAR